MGKPRRDQEFTVTLTWNEIMTIACLLNGEMVFDRDTKDIAKAYNDEIYPEMIKLSPLSAKQLGLLADKISAATTPE